MSERETPTPSPNGNGTTIGRVTTYVITNGIKVLGAYVILAEQQGEGRNWVLLAGAALALGAQTVEKIALAALDKFFGNGHR